MRLSGGSVQAPNQSHPQRREKRYSWAPLPRIVFKVYLPTARPAWLSSPALPTCPPYSELIANTFNFSVAKVDLEHVL